MSNSKNTIRKIIDNDPITMIMEIIENTNKNDIENSNNSSNNNNDNNNKNNDRKNNGINTITLVSILQLLYQAF